MKELQIQQEFLDGIGSFEPFKILFELLPNIGFYMKDLSGRLMVINRWNCKTCNIPDEMKAIGKNSYDFFPTTFADEYYLTDMTVMKTGKPLLNTVYQSPDYSTKPIICHKVPLYDKSNCVMGIATVYYFVDKDSTLPRWTKHMAEVVDFIHENYQNQIKIETLLQIVCVSESQLKHIFSQLFGLSPIGYVILTRINAARELLETTDRTVSDIAQEVGFYDHSHFIRHFKRIRRCTPSQYRKRLKHEATERPSD